MTGDALDQVRVLLEEARALDAWAQEVRVQAGVLLKRAGCAATFSAARAAAEALQVDTRLIELLLAMSLRARP